MATSDNFFQHPIRRDDRRNRAREGNKSRSSVPNVLFISEKFANEKLLRIWIDEKLIDHFQKSYIDYDCWRIQCCSEKATDTVLTMLKMIQEKKPDTWMREKWLSQK